MTRPATRYSGPIPSTLNPVTARSTNPAAPLDDTFSQAACVGLMDWMFPEGRDSDKAHQIARARGVCAQCLLIDPCARGALERDERWGVFGGIFMEDADERARARRRYGLPAIKQRGGICGKKRGTVAGYRRHIDAHETACDECRVAVNEYNTARAARLRQARKAINAVTPTEARQWWNGLVKLAGIDRAETILERITKETA